MKILIVENPRPASVEHYNDVANAPLSASLNSGYALAVAREAGWETAYLDFTACDETAPALAAQILATEADLVLVHWVYSWGDEQRVAEALRLVKKETAAPVGAFGLFPTLAPRRLFGFAGGLDFILVGEFEETLRDVLQTMETAGTIAPMPGLVLPGIEPVRREVIPELDGLPFPDDVGINADLDTLNIAGSRGCFGSCSFCFIPSFYGCRRRRVRSLASFERELDVRLSRRQSSQVYFIDPTFIGPAAGDRARAVEMGAILKRRGISFGFETRVDTVEERTIASLARDGATHVFLGVESGCDAVLRRMNKRVDKRRIVDAVRLVQKTGINLHVGFIMFEPDTTVEELRENYQFLEELGLLCDPLRTVNLLYHSQIVLYGSPSWERFEREGRLLRDERLPFEASFRFRDEKVARVCEAMRKLATEFLVRAAVPAAASEANEVLKDSFRRLLATVETAPPAEFARLERDLVEEVRGLAPAPPT